MVPAEVFVMDWIGGLREKPVKVREIEVVFGDKGGEMRDCNLFVFNNSMRDF